FGQNLIVGAAGVLLMVGTFQSLDIKVNAIDLVLASLPIAVIVFFIVWINNIRFYKYLERKYGKKHVERHELAYIKSNFRTILHINWFTITLYGISRVKSINK